MSRLLGMVSREPHDFRVDMRNIGLSRPGREHGDAWRGAVYEPQRGWSVTESAVDVSTVYDPGLGSLLLAHVHSDRGSLDGTQPFRHGEWIFAQDGAIERAVELPAALDDGRIATLYGDRANAKLYAFLISRLAIRPGATRSRLITDMLLARAVQDLANIPSLGAGMFMLSDGAALYAYRRGGPLFVLERHSDWRTEAIVIASEPLTADEPWQSVPEGTLLVIWRRPDLGWAALLEPSDGSARAFSESTRSF